MAYVADTPTPPPTAEELRRRIPGWGADLDPADRPAVPRERFAPEETGAHWEFPERQEEKAPRERSIEHAFLTPVFGTAQPLHGVSGAVRRYAYRRFSEARAAHWLMLMLADRLDVAGAAARSVLSGRPDLPLRETGALAELQEGAGADRLRTRRVDQRHAWVDPLLVAGPWIAGGALLAVGAARIVRARRR
ncbi:MULTISPECIES: hypothetical protein [Pseudoclavibacter]|uniref:Uncharacterized protein n=1 Tax=Pseudoclavibacter terrae TaxID=1530195 RepID=A0A7J5AYW4_9MICO|nr:MULTISPECIES: hypothetical protein [Pseudoclavibacter]KAB1636750.1 hypothetical protein F8O03_14340 [Pseudoclavibacter terrae]PPG41492.1 hypothetical protein C5C17_05585 [Pseudoclavibacter sp. RFBA6]